MARMKTPLLILVWLFVAQLVMAQNDVGKQAETAYQNKQFDKAAILFLQVQDYYDAACSFALGGKKKGSPDYPDQSGRSPCWKTTIICSTTKSTTLITPTTLVRKSMPT